MAGGAVGLVEPVSPYLRRISSSLASRSARLISELILRRSASASCLACDLSSLARDLRRQQQQHAIAMSSTNPPAAEQEAMRMIFSEAKQEVTYVSPFEHFDPPVVDRQSNGDEHW